MSLHKEVQAALSGWSPFDSGDRNLDVQAAGQRVHCRVVALDRIACAFLSLRLEADSLQGLSSDQLKSVAQQLSSRITYLLEPISPIEVDAEGCTVQMRSNPPHKEDGRTTYYELLVSRAGRITLERYERISKAERRTIPAEVTREVLLRLINDFSAAAG